MSCPAKVRDLYVNGGLFAYGPVKGDGSAWFFDALNLAASLHPGANTVAVAVLCPPLDPAVGMGNAGTAAAQKPGLGLGAAVFGWVISCAGFKGKYDLQGIAQPASVETAIRFM